MLVMAAGLPRPRGQLLLAWIDGTGRVLFANNAAMVG
jgi:hypothetical protein